jgi:hypothetical protein
MVMKRWLLLLVFLTLGCTGAPIAVDYSGVSDAAAAQILEGIESQGINYYYVENRGDSFSIGEADCAGYQCTVPVNLTTYYMSFYNKEFEIEMDLEFQNGGWEVSGYDIISEKEVAR